MEETILNGVAEDPRTPEQKAKDYSHEEVYAATPLKWNRTIAEAPVYSLRDQDGSYSCVGQGCSKGLETILAKVISAHPIYRRRANFDGQGMWLANAGDIVKKQGTTTEDKDPSQRMNEQQMNQDVKVETPISGYLYAFPRIQNIDEVAQAIEIYRHCMITIAGTIKEYAYTEKPVYDPNSGEINCRHCICGVYYFTDENGKKCILADESWGPNNIRRRILTEDYLKARGTGAMYFIPPTPKPTPTKPVFKFQSALLYGQNNYSIKMLQDILKYEGIFPANVDSTGFYGNITAKAVYQWQVRYNVASMQELNSLMGRRVGPKTIAKLNELYN